MGIKAPRGKGVHAAAKGSRLSRQAFGEADHCGCRSCVVDRGWERAHGADRSNVQDLSFALPDHLLVHRLGDSEQAADIDADYFVPGTIGCSSEIISAIDGRVVYQDIDA